jgi:hypothetical protein
MVVINCRLARGRFSAAQPQPAIEEQDRRHAADCWLPLATKTRTPYCCNKASHGVYRNHSITAKTQQKTIKRWIMRIRAS